MGDPGSGDRVGLELALVQRIPVINSPSTVTSVQVHRYIERDCMEESSWLRREAVMYSSLIGVVRECDHEVKWSERHVKSSSLQVRSQRLSPWCWGPIRSGQA